MIGLFVCLFSLASTAMKLGEGSEKEPTGLIHFVQRTGHIKKATLACQGRPFQCSCQRDGRRPQPRHIMPGMPGK